MFHRPKKEYIYIFRGNSESLKNVRGLVGKVCDEVGCEKKVAGAIELAIEEACSNIIRHAYMFKGGDIELHINLLRGRIVFVLIDNGRSFDYNDSETPNLERYIRTGRQGGLGLYLIRKVMDEVSYDNVNGENQLRMVRYIGKGRKRLKSGRKTRKAYFSFRTKFAIRAAASIMIIMALVFLYLNHNIVVNTRRDLYSTTLNSLNGLAARLGDKMVLKDELQLASLIKNARQTIADVKELTVVDTSLIVWADAFNESLLLSKYEFPAQIDRGLFDRYQRYRDPSSGLSHIILVPINYLGKLQGIVIADLPEKVVKDKIIAQQKNLAAISLSGIFFAFLIIYLIANYHSKPVSKLSASVGKIGNDGTLDGKLEVNGRDEISEIARAFNEMSERFKEHQKIALAEERLRVEMNNAEAIQKALLPKKVPDIEGFEIASVYEPSRSVSGDYFDFVKVDDDHLGIIIADVSGGGVPGSLVMSILRTAIRLVAVGELSPVAVLKKVNDLIREDVGKGMFITAFYMVLDIKKQKIVYSSAGHNPMILFRRAEGECYLLNPAGFPMGLSLPDGIVFGKKLESGELDLYPDDLIFLYTDGVTECRNGKRETFGEDRLVEFIRQESFSSSKDLAEALKEKLDSFTEGVPYDDDITFVVLRGKTVDVGKITEHKGKHNIKMVRQGERGLSDKGIPNRETMKPREIGVLNYRQSVELKKIILGEPSLDVKAIYNRFREVFGGDGFSLQALYGELKRLHLDSAERRKRFVARYKFTD